MEKVKTMPSTIVSEDSVTTCTKLIHTSNHLYRQMLQLLQALSISPETSSPTQLAAQQEQLTQLQANIEANDRLLNKELLDLKGEEETLAELLQERRSLLIELLQCNRTVSNKARAIRSLIGDEIRKSSVGHVALKGYRSADYRQRSGTFTKSM